MLEMQECACYFEAGLLVGLSTLELKSSSQKYRREVVTPAVIQPIGVAANPPLPWHWIAAVASNEFRESFEMWWQMHVFGHVIPLRQCPWCTDTDLTSVHLVFHCARWASLCF